MCANPTVFNNSPIRDTWPPGDFRCFRYGGYLGVLARPLLNPGSKNIDFLDFLKTPKRSIFPKSPGGPGGARGEAPGPGARGGRSRELQIRDPEFFSVFENPGIFNGFSMKFNDFRWFFNEIHRFPTKSMGFIVNYILSFCKLL